ncbi:DUF2927 domain-containing protein [Candidatus Poribacteria bacterium]|nr:DUF2927 domain-containing protein [Candidatus Poribacteria bacterium]
MESISHTYFTKPHRQSTQFSKTPKLILGGLSGYWLSLFCLLTWVMPADSHRNRSVQSLVEGQLKLSSSLRVGQSGTLTLYCFSRSNVALRGQIKFRLPKGIEALSQANFDQTYLPAYGQQQYQIAIRVGRVGHYPLQASFHFTETDGQKSEHFYLYLQTTPSQAETAKHPLVNQQQNQQLQVGGLVNLAAFGGLSLGGTINYYNDNFRQIQPLVRAKVKLFQSNVLLDQTFSDLDGQYLFEEVSLQPQVTNILQVSIEMENDILIIASPSREVYTFKSDLIQNVEAGHIQRDLILDETNPNRGVGYIFETIQKAHDFLLDQVDTRRTKSIPVIWPESADGSYYYTTQFFGRISSESIHIAAGGDQWRKNVMYHEYGHALMSAVYNYDFNDIPRGESREFHRLEMVTDPEFALSEGWAEFLEAAVDDRALNVTGFLNGRDPNLENNRWWSGAHDGSGSNSNGALVEGAVASILWDIFDTANSIDLTPNLDDDQIENRFDLLWSILRDQRPKTIVEIAQVWREKEYPDWEALQDIYASHRTLSQLNQAPTFIFANPLEADVVTDQTYQINWTANDPDGDDYQVDLYYYPSGQNYSRQPKLISEQVKDNNYLWNIADITSGRYYLLAIVTDSKGESVEVSSQSVVIIDQTPMLLPEVTSPTHPESQLGVANNSPIFNLSIFPIDTTDDSKSVYSYLLDRQPNTIPDTEADLQVFNHQLRFYGLEPGKWWLHVRAYDPLGYWSQTKHFAFTILPSNDQDNLNSSVIDYLIELTLSESTENRLKKWSSEIRIQPHGFIRNGDLSVLNETIDLLNSLMDTVQIQITDQAPNFNIYFYPSIMLGFLESSYKIGSPSFLSIRWQKDQIIESKVLIDSFGNSQTQRNYLIRKRVVQGLGLIMDGQSYPDSIFYQGENSVAELTPIDQQVISVLYDNQIKSGMTTQKLKDLVQNPKKIPIWQAEITVESLSATMNSRQLFFGVSEEATDGFDSGIDQLEIPPKTQSLWNSYLIGNQSDTDPLVADFRSPFDTATYRIRVQSYGQNFRMKWNISAIPAEFDCVSIQVISPPSSIVYDMRQRQEFTLKPETDQDYVFEITVGTYHIFTLDLLSGWNLISIPGIPKTAEISAVFAQHSSLVPPFYGWDSAQYNYRPTTELVVGQGYWILSTDPNTIQLEIPLIETESYQRSISTGWNLVGAPNQSVDFTNMTNVSDGSSVADSTIPSILRNSLYNWQPDVYAYDLSSWLEPGKGYWVLSMGECQLQVNANTIEKSSSAAPLFSISTPQPNFQLPLTVTVEGQPTQLAIGWGELASPDLDVYDRVIPPNLPIANQPSAYLLQPNSSIRLQTDIRPNLEDARWQLITSSESYLTIEAGHIPTGYKFLLQGKAFTIGQQFHLADRRVSLSLKRDLPITTTLRQNYPNPFNPETWIPFDLAEEADVSLNIYNSEGLLIRDINLGLKPAGSYRDKTLAMYWDGKNQQGEPVTSGVYFYRIRAGDYSQIRKMVILK